MNKKKIIIAGLALALTMGVFGTAQAWNGDFGHHVPSGHKISVHGYDLMPVEQVAANFNDHGGGHETAPNNIGIHNAEMKNPNHKNPVTINPKAKFDEHGGGHETAPDNATIHEREMKDTNHKDTVG